MARRAGLLGLSVLVILSGCVQMSEPTALIPFSPFNSNSTTAARPAQDAAVAPPATQEASLTVGKVGRKLLAANPTLGFRPMFVTLGGETTPPELFHKGDAEVLITESLARKCKSEAELAALLSRELGKIASEKAGLDLAMLSDRGPPPAVSIGNDYGGSFGPADGIRQMELAKYERKRARDRDQVAPPDPNVLARAYLQRAGFNPAELDSVTPLLAAADGNSRFEKAMTAGSPK